MINNLDTRVGISTMDFSINRVDVPYQESLITQRVREALISGGLGQQDPKIPFADIIKPGMTVLLKPNWVLHYNQSGRGMECMVTQPDFLFAIVKEVTAAKPGRIWIGDAPIQSCVFSEIVTPALQTRLQNIAGCPIEFLDFRRVIIQRDNHNSVIRREGRDESHYVLFDLKEDSLLEPISKPGNRFRVTGYNPDDVAHMHNPGRHQYLLCREAFQADIILNLPKLKCHSKAGITAALKNVIGFIGKKEYLPHHRIGGTALGGDCYRGLAPLKRLAEFCLDQSNKVLGTPAFLYWRRMVNRLQNLQRRFGNPDIEGGWYGNDTVWRMTLDINRILHYGSEDGTLSDTSVRRIYSLTDGIIAGQQDGPLSPSPIPLGIVTFASSSCFGDLVHSALMHFDWRKIPLVREAFNISRYPLTLHGPKDCQISSSRSNTTLCLSDTAQLLGRDVEAASGWKGHIEWNGAEL